MPSRMINAVLGIIFYALGVITINTFFSPLNLALSPLIEIVIITLGIFFISAAFFGGYGFVAFFFAGTAIGSSLPQNQSYVILSVFPLIVALLGGSLMGKMASLDLAGKKNLFEEKTEYIAYIILSLVMALVVGFLYDYLPAIII